MTQAPRDDEDPGQEPLLPMSQEFAGWVEKNDARPLPETGKWKPSEHTKLVKATMDAMERLPGRRRIRKRTTGRFIATDGNGDPRKIHGKWVYVKVSIAGDPDVEVSWQPPGWGNRPPIMVALECKTGTGRLSEDQREARDDLVAMGWLFIECRDAAEALQQVMALRGRP